MCGLRMAFPLGRGVAVVAKAWAFSTLISLHPPGNDRFNAMMRITSYMYSTEGDCTRSLVANIKYYHDV